MAVKLVVTGSRHGHPDVDRWLRAWNAKHGAPELCILGDAKGVDTQAYKVAKLLGWPVVVEHVVPAEPSPLRYHNRNRRMIDLADPGDACLAFPGHISRGTFHCAQLARAKGLIVYMAKCKNPATLVR